MLENRVLIYPVIKQILNINITPYETFINYFKQNRNDN